MLHHSSIPSFVFLRSKGSTFCNEVTIVGSRALSITLYWSRLVTLAKLSCITLHYTGSDNVDAIQQIKDIFAIFLHN